ncbi:unnamed protein product [Peronospora belbahrii]|uniref:Uncharacterized protein n=1 Tax=Peronospora belbahrii TaxID=622444 RepID=A0AAU9KQF1_9STRA|nr:unnamed protein product [Peronospora belbahrii]CAH0515487.1 unnamed protein product [Peronospora belbahrii]
MYEVQVVRHRGATGTRGRLEALRRRFVMTVCDRFLKLCVDSLSLTSAVLSISSNRIKNIRVRRRLLRVMMDNGYALTVRLQDQEEALRAAETMMDTWDIDPLVEDTEIPSVQSEVQVDCTMALLVRHYMDDPNFRHLVHRIHDHIDAVVANDELCFKARV